MSEIYQWSIRDWSASAVRDWSMISRRLICCIYPRKINDQLEIDKLHLSENDQWSNRRWISCIYQRLINDQPEIDQLLNLSEIDQWLTEDWFAASIRDWSMISRRLISCSIYPRLIGCICYRSVASIRDFSIRHNLDLIFQFQLRKPSTFCPFLV